jgi:hypothetical protein
MQNPSVRQKTPIVQGDAGHRRGALLAAQVAGLPVRLRASTIGLGDNLRSDADIGVALLHDEGAKRPDCESGDASRVLEYVEEKNARSR